VGKRLGPEAMLARCRCNDPDGTQWVYLNAFCPNRDQHRPWDDYGFTQNSLMKATAEYHRAWLAGELNADIPAEARPGYRP
jgi:hypothetical protein